MLSRSITSIFKQKTFDRCFCYLQEEYFKCGTVVGVKGSPRRHKKKRFSFDPQVSPCVAALDHYSRFCGDASEEIGAWLVLPQHLGLIIKQECMTKLGRNTRKGKGEGGRREALYSMLCLS